MPHPCPRRSTGDRQAGAGGPRDDGRSEAAAVPRSRSRLRRCAVPAARRASSPARPPSPVGGSLAGGWAHGNRYVSQVTVPSSGRVEPPAARTEVALVIVALLVGVASGLGVTGNRVPGWERGLFRTVNDLP